MAGQRITAPLTLQRTVINAPLAYGRGPAGADGGGTGTGDGREVELRNNGTYIQWRYEGEASWTNLVALSAITGPAGTNGTNGAAGPANTLAIGTVTTGAEGSSASATITGDAPNQTLNLTIPRGDTGAGGGSIPDNSVAAAKLTATGTAKVFGRYSSGAGAGEELSLDAVFTTTGRTLGLAEDYVTPTDLTAAVAAIFQKSLITTDQANGVSSVLATLHTFTVGPGKTLELKGLMLGTAGATTTGIVYGVYVANAGGNDGLARGSVIAEVGVTSAASAAGLMDGDTVSVAAGANTSVTVTGTATASTGNHPCRVNATICNLGTTGNVTVEVVFSTEVNGSSVTAKAGSIATAMIF